MGGKDLVRKPRSDFVFETEPNLGVSSMRGWPNLVSTLLISSRFGWSDSIDRDQIEMLAGTGKTNPNVDDERRRQQQKQRRYLGAHDVDECLGA